MIIILLLIAHLLGDYYFQPKHLVDLKRKSIKNQLIHSLIYTFVLTIFMLPFGNLYQIILSVVIVFTSHLVIDYFRILFEKKNPSPKKELVLFFVDQILHLFIIVLIGYLLSHANFIGNFLLQRFSNILGITNLFKLFKIIFCYLLLLTPSSIIIKHVLNYIDIKNEDKNIGAEELCLCKEDKTTVGALIGMLERVLVFTLGLMGLYSSIALILTAKSIARFKQLDDKEFAEKYLVGTLFSILIAVFCIVLIII